jgi:hypothetical protein
VCVFTPRFWVRDDRPRCSSTIRLRSFKNGRKASHGTSAQNFGLPPRRSSFSPTTFWLRAASYSKTSGSRRHSKNRRSASSRRSATACGVSSEAEQPIQNPKARGLWTLDARMALALEARLWIALWITAEGLTARSARQRSLRSSGRPMQRSVPTGLARGEAALLPREPTCALVRESRSLRPPAAGSGPDSSRRRRCSRRSRRRSSRR